MTQVERLIRNLCEERRLGILEGEREAIRQVPDAVSWNLLPMWVRAAVREYRKLEKRQKGVQERVRRAGFQSHSLYVGKPLALVNHPQRQTAVREKYNLRRAKIQKLRTDATIASLGKTAVEAQGILAQLQKDLAAV